MAAAGENGPRRCVRRREEAGCEHQPGQGVLLHVLLQLLLVGDGPPRDLTLAALEELLHVGAHVRVALGGAHEATQHGQPGVTFGEGLAYEAVPLRERGRAFVPSPAVDPVVGVVHESDGGHDVRHQRGGEQ